MYVSTQLKMEPEKKKRKRNYVRVAKRDLDGCWRMGKGVCSLIAEYVAETEEECLALGVSDVHRETVKWHGPFTQYKLTKWCRARIMELKADENMLYRMYLGRNNAKFLLEQSLIGAGVYPYLKTWMRVYKGYECFYGNMIGFVPLPAVEDYVIIVQKVRDGQFSKKTGEYVPWPLPLSHAFRNP